MRTAAFSPTWRLWGSNEDSVVKSLEQRGPTDNQHGGKFHSKRKRLPADNAVEATITYSHQVSVIAASLYCLHPDGFRLLVYPNKWSCRVKKGSLYVFHGDRSNPYGLCITEYSVAFAMTGTYANRPLSGVISFWQRKTIIVGGGGGGRGGR